MTYIALLTGLLCFGSSQTYAQAEVTLADTIQHKLSLYQQKNPASLLFVHFDKTLYSNNENVWFTAYLLNCNKPQLHHTLSVSLVNDIDHTIALQEKFVMGAGLAFGNIFLPDSIPPGNYTFMVHTNRMAINKPEAVFTQSITIKNTTPPDFKAMLSLADTGASLTNKPRRVTLNVNGNDYMPFNGAIIDYEIRGTDTVVIRHKAKTNNAGQYNINVPPNKTVVKLQVKSKKSSQYLHLFLPQGKDRLSLKFYPEGGSMINGLLTTVGWEAKTSNGQPLLVNGLLYQNNKLIDTISTDSYGMGKFVLLPQQGSIYSFKLAGYTNIKDTAYLLPAVTSTGVTVHIDKGIANDTLNLQINSMQSGILYINIHNYNQHFFTVPVRVNAYTNRRVKIDLIDLPKGLAEITITDSIGRPLAERLFFAHFNVRDHLNITTDKATYKPREKVELKLELANSEKLTMGAVSIACVQENRIELKKVNDIESYTYLKSIIGEIPLKERYLNADNKDKQYLENLLLIKGWRKYNWFEMLQATPLDTATYASSLIFSGNITINNKVTKKPVTFILARDSSSQILVTDNKGSFPLAYEQLINTQDKEIKFLVAAKSGSNYNIQIDDPYDSLHKKMVAELCLINYQQPAPTFDGQSFAMTGMQHAIKLDAVNIIATKDNLLYGINACGDYVCSFGILNCANHVNAVHTLPVKGVQYKYLRKIIVYEGCAEANGLPAKAIHGIYTSKQYYGSDYSVDNPTEPEYVSTIFWKHMVALNSRKQTELTFYTGDITGKFKIVVQGITSKGVTYAERTITVTKP